MTPGSRPWVVRSLREWAISIGQGMALVTYRSGRARDETLRDLERELHERQITTEILECGACNAQEFVLRIERSHAGVLFVLDPDSVLFRRGDDRAAFWVNFHRETLAAHPGVQFWWMTPDSAILFGQQVPDLSRFFLFREELSDDADIAYSPLWRLDPFASGSSADPPRYRELLRRALHAADNPNVERLRIWTDLALPALHGLARSGLEAEAATGLLELERKIGLAKDELAKGDTAPSQELGAAYLALMQIFFYLARPEDAFEIQERAVPILRRVVERNPDRFQTDLAWLLVNLAVRRRMSGQHETALQYAQEAVRICRRLSDDKRKAFRSLLLGSLSALAVCQNDMGKRDEALESRREFDAILRRRA